MILTQPAAQHDAMKQPNEVSVLHLHRDALLDCNNTDKLDDTSFSNRILSILSLILRILPTSLHSETNWPYSLETSTETLRSILALMENFMEKLAGTEDGTASPAHLRDSGICNSLGSIESEMWNAALILMLLAEANIKAFISHCDSINADHSLIEDGMDENPQNEAKSDKLSNDPRFVNDSEYDSDEEAQQTDKLQQQDESAEQLRDSFESFKGADSLGSSLMSEKNLMRLSPAHSISNKSVETADCLGDGLYADSSEEDSEDWDVQSALLSSYGNDQLELQLPMVENIDEVLPRLFDVLCNISFTAFKSLSAHDEETSICVWSCAQYIIGGICSRAFLSPSELRRTLIDLLLNPKDLLHIAPGLVMASNIHETVLDDLVYGEAVELPCELDVGKFKVLLQYLSSRCDFDILLLQSQSDLQGAECQLWIVRSLYELVLQTIVCWVKRFGKNDIRWQEMRDVFGMIVEGMSADSNASHDPSRKRSTFTLAAVFSDFLGKLCDVVPDLASVAVILPFSITIMQNTSFQKSSGDLFADIAVRLASLLSLNLRFILSLVRRGIVPLDSQSACWSFRLSIGMIRGRFPISPSTLDDDVWNMACACLDRAVTERLRSSQIGASGAIPKLHAIAESLDAYFSSNIGIGESLNKLLSSFLDTFCAAEARDLHDRSLVSIRRNLFLKYVQHNGLENPATQAYANVALSNGALMNMSDLDSSLYSAWVSSHVLSALCCAYITINSVNDLFIVAKSAAEFADDAPIDFVGSSMGNNKPSDADLSDFLREPSIKAILTGRWNMPLLKLGQASVVSVETKAKISCLQLLAFLTCSKSTEELHRFAFFDTLISSFYAFALSTAAAVIEGLRSVPRALEIFLVDMDMGKIITGAGISRLCSEEASLAASELGRVVAQYVNPRNSTEILKALMNCYACITSACPLSEKVVVSLMSFAANCMSCLSFSTESALVDSCERIDVYAGAIGICAQCLQRRSDVVPRSALMLALCEELRGHCANLVEQTLQLFRSLSSYIKVLSYSKTSVIASSPRDLEACSPSIYPGLNTPHGGYVIDYWIQVSHDSNTTTPRRMHVMSRLPDILDFNVISLLNCELQRICHPSILLSISPEGEPTLLVSTASGDSSSIAIEHKIPSGVWIHCGVQYKQGKADLGEISVTEAAYPSSLSLYINGTLAKTVNVPFSKYKLNGRLVVGGIPNPTITSNNSVRVSDIHFSSYQKSSLDESSALQEKLRVYANPYPPHLLGKTICSCLLLIRHVLEILLADQLRSPFKDVEQLLARWTSLKNIILTTAYISDEPTAAMALALFDDFVKKLHIIEISWNSGKASKSLQIEALRVDLASALDAFINMAYAFVDCNLESRLDLPIIDSKRLVWLERVNGTNCYHHFLTFC